MSNPYNNEIIFNGQTLMSLKEDTVTPDKVLAGETFHDRSGAPQTGSLITHNVYDGLDSTSASDALSANQGRVLNEKYNSLNDGIIHKYINTDTLLSPLDTSSTFKSFETIGKNVYITFRGASRSHTEGEVFLQIPAGYRSGNSRYFVICIGTSAAIGEMNRNGEVSIWSTSPPNGRLVCSLSYCIE